MHVHPAPGLGPRPYAPQNEVWPISVNTTQCPGTANHLHLIELPAHGGINVCVGCGGELFFTMPSLN